jgi:DNA-binding transcriptional regulator YdaS (Cro superfamily)
MKLEDYLEQERGRSTELADLLGVVPSLISMWASGSRKVPAEWCMEIEHATGGKVKAEDMRPDLNWKRFRKASDNHA